MEPHKLQRLIFQRIEELEELEKQKNTKRKHRKTDFGAKCTSYGCGLWCDGCIENRNKHTCLKEVCDQDVGYKG